MITTVEYRADYSMKVQGKDEYVRGHTAVTVHDDTVLSVDYFRDIKVKDISYGSHVSLNKPKLMGLVKITTQTETKEEVLFNARSNNRRRHR